MSGLPVNVRSKVMSSLKSPNEDSPVKLKSLALRKQAATRIIHRLRELDPNPRCELYYETPFQLLVSVVLSAQTTDKMVNRCMEPLYKKGFTVETVLRLGPEKLLEKIRTIGLAPTKSKNIYKLSQLLKTEFQSDIPKTRAELESLPGVGKKTASVILGEIFGEPTLAVDTHVYRVTKRLGLHDETSPEKAEPVLLQVVAKKHRPKAHHWFILLGRYTCKARNPECETCVLAPTCPSAF